MEWRFRVCQICVEVSSIEWFNSNRKLKNAFNYFRLKLLEELTKKRSKNDPTRRNVSLIETRNPASYARSGRTKANASKLEKGLFGALLKTKGKSKTRGNPPLLWSLLAGHSGRGPPPKLFTLADHSCWYSSPSGPPLDHALFSLVTSNTARVRSCSRLPSTTLPHPRLRRKTLELLLVKLSVSKAHLLATFRDPLHACLGRVL